MPGPRTKYEHCMARALTVTYSRVLFHSKISLFCFNRIPWDRMAIQLKGGWLHLLTFDE